MKLTKLQIGFFVFIALAYMALTYLVMVPAGIENIADIEAMSDGSTVVASYNESTLSIDVLLPTGSVSSLDSFHRTQKNGVVSVVDLASDESGYVYVLINYLDAYTGEISAQGLLIYDTGKSFHTQVKSLLFENQPDLEYRWIEISSASLSMLSVNDAGTLLTRELFDLTSLLQGTLYSKGSKSYLLQADEGIFEVEPIGTSVAYMSMSGKIFLATDTQTQAVELYPARVLEELMYPAFISAISDTVLFMGEQESGDLLLLNIETGETTVYKSGSEPFSGLSSYAPEDVLAMSVYDPDNYSAVLKNDNTGYYDILVANSGDIYILTSLQGSAWLRFARTLGVAVLLLVGCFVLGLLWNLARQKISASRSIRTKLILATLPVLVLAIGLLGYFTYLNYAQSIQESFYKQIQDEGNVLMALFGTESFEEIEFPYDYPDEAYQYLSQQMQTRDLYTRTGYYENGTLYIGVDSGNPCFYTMDTLMDTNLLALYEKAALTGQAQTGIISDANGQRLTCVTPVGALDSTTVYLLETGVSVANVTRYTSAYLANFALIAGAFILIVGVLMVMLIVNVLQPLHQMKDGLEAFAKGDRTVRLNTETGDEFSDISRVFNKLVGDIDMQLFDLKRISEVYYRFIPQQMLRLLDAHRLGNITLGSSVEGEYVILLAQLHVGGIQTTDSMSELTSTFFNILQEVCATSETATLVSDSANLRRICVLCPAGSEDAVNIALAAIARMDATNANLPIQMQMEVAFVVDKAEVYYGICGDETRFMPALISPKMDWLAYSAPLFEQLASRLIVTELACAELDLSHFYSRYIGAFQWGKASYGLYDFYDSTSPEQTRLIHTNLATFNKAMELYQQARYYDAKNLFAMVLRENRFDNVARYYLFEAEKHLQSTQTADVQTEGAQTKELQFI